MPVSVDGAVPEQRIVEAAAVLPDFGGATGWASLRWAGGVWFDGTTVGGQALLPVTLATGYSDVRSQAGIVISQERLGPGEIEELDGMRVTTLVRSLCFEMRYASDKREAAVLLDMAAYSDLVSIEEAAIYALAHPGWTGIPQCRDALSLADENSWSPWESRLRIVWVVDGGFPRPWTNCPVFDRYGCHLGTPDLLDEEAGLAIEYDGAHHQEHGQRRRDRDREQAFRGVGLEYLTIMRGDFANRYVLAERLADARRRSRWSSTARREWTIDLPPSWTPTFTVEQRRNLDDQQRARLLRLRRRID